MPVRSISFELRLAADGSDVRPAARETLAKATEQEWKVLVAWATQVVALAEAVDQEISVVVAPASALKDLEPVDPAK